MRPKKTILCVDDNEQTLSVRKFLLETRGYRVFTAVNGQEAISVFSSTQIDLVVTDLGLPQMDGNALIGHLKEISSEIPMILTSDSVRAGERTHRAADFRPETFELTLCASGTRGVMVEHAPRGAR